MPTYDYQCKACGHTFERVQRITEEATKDCPNCGKLEASRQIKQANFILKGSGWYGDLYSGASNKKDGGASAAGVASETGAVVTVAGDATAASPSTKAAPAASTESTSSTPSSTSSVPAPSTGSSGSSTS